MTQVLCTIAMCGLWKRRMALGEESGLELWGEVHECHPVVDTGILDQKISRYGDKIYAV